MTPREVRRLLARCCVMLACVVVGGCMPPTGLVDEADTRPSVGRCYDTPDAVLPDAHDPTEPVDCGRPHTLETFAVLAVEGPLNARTVAAQSRRCSERLRDFLGGDDVARTAVSVYYFTPAPAQREDGARWVRCDAAVVADTALTSTRRMTGSLEDAFADGVPAAYRRCLSSPPKPAGSQPLVPCTQPHAAQQLPQGVDLGDADRPYPGTDGLAARANAKCAPMVRAELPDAARSLVIVPTPQMWRDGITTAQCWALAGAGERLNDSEAQPA